MTRPALSSPPNRDRVADTRRAAVDPVRRPDSGLNHAQGFWQRHVDMLFVTRAGHRGGPIGHRHAPPWRLPPSRGWAKGMGADTAHAGDEAGAGRVVIIGCEQRLFVHTASKNWAMTDRQIGWLQVHPSLGQKTEKMIPWTSWRRAAVALPERGAGPSSGAHGEGARGRPHGRPRAMGACLERQSNPGRRAGRSINRATHRVSGGRWSTGARVWAPVARGVHYNWKGPPIGLPLRVPGSRPGSESHTV
jgi:hypothetical protein